MKRSMLGMIILVCTAFIIYPVMNKPVMQDMEKEPNAYLSNIVFWTSDLEKMLSFFGTIGLEPHFARMDAEPRFAFYSSGPGFDFSVFQAGGEVPAVGGWAKCPNDPKLNESWAPYFSINVKDIQAVVERCRKADIPMRQEEAFELKGGNLCLEVMDPDGRTFALIQKR